MTDPKNLLEKVTTHNNLVYYDMCQIVIMLFDLNSEKSFEEAKDWIKVLNEIDIKVLLVGNIKDINMKLIKNANIQKYALDSKLSYHEISLKEEKGVKELFDKVISYGLDIETPENGMQTNDKNTCKMYQ